jgi:transposase-like protein
MTAAKKKLMTRTVKRDGDGLIEGLDYTFEDNGLIDWRKMVRSEFLVPNKDRTKEADISKLQDRDLIILLGGLKDLSQKRGYTKVDYKIYEAREDYVCASCRIEWIPNFETEGRAVSFESLASTTLHNTKDFGQLYLAEMAENRAFCRSVRNFLRINIVSADEMSKNSTMNPFTPNGDSDSSNSSNDPAQILAAAMKSKGVTFDNLKKRLVAEGYTDAEELNSVSDISKTKIFELISRIKNKK